MSKIICSNTQDFMDACAALVTKGIRFNAEYETLIITIVGF